MHLTCIIVLSHQGGVYPEREDHIATKCCMIQQAHLRCDAHRKVKECPARSVYPIDHEACNPSDFIVYTIECHLDVTSGCQATHIEFYHVWRPSSPVSSRLPAGGAYLHIKIKKLMKRLCDNRKLPEAHSNACAST